MKFSFLCENAPSLCQVNYFRSYPFDLIRSSRFYYIDIDTSEQRFLGAQHVLVINGH